MQKSILIALSCLMIMGCARNFSTAGGGSVIQVIKEITSLDDKNKPVTTKTTTNIKVEQPANPQTGAVTTIKTDPKTGDPIITTDTGGAQDVSKVAKTIAGFDAMNPIIWLGGILFVAGIVGGLVTKRISIGLAGMLGGLALIAAAVAIAQYTWIIALVGGAIFLAIVAWLAFHYIVQHRGNIDNVSLIEALKKDLPEDLKQKYFTSERPFANIMQHPSTVKLVDEIKNREGLR